MSAPKLHKIIDEWVVTSVDIGGGKEIYRGPDEIEAVIAWAEAKLDNEDELGVLIQHTLLAR